VRKSCTRSVASRTAARVQCEVVVQLPGATGAASSLVIGDPPHCVLVLHTLNSEVAAVATHSKVLAVSSCVASVWNLCGGYMHVQHDTR
jgi:hypothetical protein